MSSPLKLANTKTIANILSKYKGTSLKPGSKLPSNYAKLEEKEGSVLQRTYVYQDFKEAFNHFILISKTCQSFNYYPEMFNVYNRVEVKLFTK
jgi:pterin-4a-carbinolamine dehydratase